MSVLIDSGSVMRGSKSGVEVRLGRKANYAMGMGCSGGVLLSIPESCRPLSLLPKSG